MKRTLLSFFAALMASASIFAQNWEIGLGLHAMNFQGDVVEPQLFTLKETNPNFGIFARRNFSNEHFGLRLGVTLGRLTGDDSNFDDPSWRKQRAFSFKSPLTEIAGMLEWNALTRDKSDGTPRRAIPYFFAGLGAALTNPTVDWNTGQTVVSIDRIAQDQRDVKKSTLAIPLGAGFKFSLGRGTLGVELGVRPTVSDYLDGISQAANPDLNDWYLIGGVNYAIQIGKKASDSDGDGIPDKKDKCPDLKGVKGNQGCPMDSDSDGVYDSEDRCADLPGDKMNGGCPALPAADKAILTEAISNINFETASANLTAESLPILDKVADVLSRYPYYSVGIEGHTDSQGDDASNLALSKNRAKSCLNYLLSKGIAAGRMTSEGFGETRPIASNDTDAGRRQNRRVEFKLTVK